jgi:hypothetical protein
MFVLFIFWFNNKITKCKIHFHVVQRLHFINLGQKIIRTAVFLFKRHNDVKNDVRFLVIWYKKGLKEWKTLNKNITILYQ